MINPAQSSIICEEALKEWTKYTRTSDLIAFLDRNGIDYFIGKAGSVCTTIEALNHALKDNAPEKMW